MATAKHRAIDLVRRRSLLDRKYNDIGDDLLRLIFTSCHPVLSNEAQQVESTCVGPLALTLRLIGGLTTNEIARAFLVPEPAIAHRIVRAKRTLPDAHVP